MEAVLRLDVPSRPELLDAERSVSAADPDPLSDLLWRVGAKLVRSLVSPRIEFRALDEDIDCAGGDEQHGDDG